VHSMVHYVGTLWRSMVPHSTARCKAVTFRTAPSEPFDLLGPCTHVMSVMAPDTGVYEKDSSLSLRGFARIPAAEPAIHPPICSESLSSHVSSRCRVPVLQTPV